MTHTNDPIQGLIDYVNEVKPFHTKILEVAVAYAHNEDVDITITEDFNLDIALFWPTIVGSPKTIPLRVCSAGYGVEFDRSTPYIVVDASISPQSVSLEGDHTNTFVVGTKFEIREPYTTDALGSPVGSPRLSTPRVATVLATSVTYDTDTNTTVIGIVVLSEDYLGSPVFSAGSPLVAPPGGSPPVTGSEFWLPSYGANDSGGDVFVVYDVVETKTLNIITRPVVYYGSPIIKGGSPFTPIWPYPEGSPLPGSPKLVTGSPATYPTFGSPNISGNTITIKSTTPDIFLYGQEVEIRNASDPDINRRYNIHRTRDLGGSPNLVELTVLDTVLADTTNDGELVFTPDGFSGGDICGDVPPEWMQVHWLEDLDMSWRFVPGEGTSGVMLPAFQHFILESNNTSNTVTVQGDVRYIVQEFGSPIGGSPTAVPATIIHARTAYGSPFWVGSPHVDVNASLSVVIGNITYDANTNTSTLQLDTTYATPTGWIVPVLPSPLPLGVLAVGGGGNSTTNPLLYYSVDGVTNWNTFEMVGSGPGSPNSFDDIDLAYDVQYMANLDQWVILTRSSGNNRTLVWTTSDVDPGDSTTWTKVFDSSLNFQAGALKYANGRLVFTAWTGRVWYTDDLVTFNTTTFASGNTIFSIDYGGVGSWGTGFWTVGGGNGDGAYSTDNGVTWTTFPTTATGDIRSMVCGDEEGGSGFPRIIVHNETASAPGNNIYTSDNGGSTWVQRTASLGDTGGRCVGRNWVTGTLIAGDESGRWMRSTDNGTTWQNTSGQDLLTSGSPVASRDVWPAVMNHVIYDEGNQIWIAGGGGPSVLVSDDDGLTWTQYTTGLGSPSDGSAPTVIGAKAESTA